MVPRAGDRIGPYEVIGRLGSGGMGLVYSALDTRLQREVAIKLLREEYATPGMRQRFLQEARAASRLNHPNICTIFDIGEQEGDPYLVMELLKGETVRTRITRGPASSADIICVATEVADALAVAHGRGIIHRDIKPANIILVNKNQGRFQAKVLDFGLAKVERDGAISSADLTSAGTTVGTVSYMSPEQARGESLDARSDLFSLGTVLYEMATGELPFQGATSALVFVQLLGEQPEPVRDFNPDISRDLEKVIATLLEKKRSERFQSAAEVVEALSRVQSKKPSKGFWGGNKPAKSWPAGEVRAEKRAATPAPPATASPTYPPTYPRTLPARRPTREAVLDSLHESRMFSKGSPRSEPKPPPSTPPPSTPPPSTQPPAQGPETHLRPVKRVISSDSAQIEASPEARARQDAKAELPGVQPSAFKLFQQASSAAHRTVASPQDHMSSAHLAAASPTVPSGATPADAVRRPGASAWSSSGVLPAVVAGDRIAEHEDEPLAGTMQPASSDAPAREQRTLVPTTAPLHASTGKAGAWEVHDNDETVAPASGSYSTVRKAILLVILALLVAAGWFVWYRRALPSGTGVSSLLLIPVENQTGDSVLGGALDSGLLFELRQSPHISVRQGEDLQAGAVLAGVPLASTPLTLGDARRIASSAGATLVALGSIAQEGNAYALTLRVYDVSHGTQLIQVVTKAGSREQIIETIGELAADTRIGLGEAKDAVADYVPLSKEASSNANALQAFATADKFEAGGNLLQATQYYEQAVKLDANFPQANVALAKIYAQQHAFVEAAAAASRARAHVADTSSRNQALVAASYALYKLGDAAQAVRLLTELVAQFPGDSGAFVELAAAQRAAHNPDAALAAAQSALQVSPQSNRGRAEAELALISLDRLDEASQMEQQAQAAGQPHAALVALLGLLNLPTPLPGIAASPEAQLPASLERADILDAEGQFAKGLVAWREAIGQATSVPSLSSAASFGFARAGLNRALAGDCGTALPLLRELQSLPQAAETSLDAGVADALCGDREGAKTEGNRLTAGSPGMLATSLYAPVVQAVVAWKSNDSAAALALLAGKGDQLWLAAYLSGLIHAATNSGSTALTDLQPLTVHHGSVAEEQSLLVALGEFQAAQAFDSRNGPIHFHSFLNLWSNADPNQAMLTQAEAQAR